MTPILRTTWEPTVRELLTSEAPELQLRTLFQPLVELETGLIVGYEALTRGPAGSSLERPDLLFAAAESEGLLIELDHRCQSVAMETASTTPALRGHLVFFNAEPIAFTFNPPERLQRAWGLALDTVRPVLEISERRVLDNPAALLEGRRFLQQAGMLAAVDDVGVNPDSLALLPLLEPDIVKLDMIFMRESLNAELACVVNAVSDYQERSGALVVAEGIETAEHVHRATGFGADLGQGFFWAKPAPPDDLEPAHRFAAHPVERRIDDGALTPFDLVAADRRSRIATRDVLAGISLDLERQALQLNDRPLVLAGFQDHRGFDGQTRDQYRELARVGSYVAAVGPGFTSGMIDGVYTASLHEDDPLVAEWNLVVLSPHFAGAVTAQKCDPAGPGGEGRYRYHVTFDRGLVAAAARILLSRIEAGID